MHTWFPDDEQLLFPVFPTSFSKVFYSVFNGLNYEEEFASLKKMVRQLGENIPPLFSAYMNLSATLKTLGSALNTHLGDVDETAILLTISDIYPDKAQRHIDSYLSSKSRNVYSNDDNKIRFTNYQWQH